MENEEIRPESVPYIVHESEMARMERVNKRQTIIIYVLLFIILATNAGWIWHESQYIDEVTETIETSAEGGGNAYGTIISGDGSEVNYGANESDANKNPNP